MRPSEAPDSQPTTTFIDLQALLDNANAFHQVYLLILSSGVGSNGEEGKPNTRLFGKLL